MSSNYNVPDFPPDFVPDPAFMPPHYEQDPQSSSVLAQLIETGTIPRDLPVLPKKWQKAYDTVLQVLNTSRAARFNAFKVAIKDFKQNAEMWREVDEAMQHTEDRSDTLSHRIFYSAEEALYPPPPLAWLVDGLLPAPSLTLLVGDPGTKKTFLAIDLAVCIALGKPWLGRTTEPTPTMFVDEETGLHQLWPRLNACLRAHEAPYSTPLYFCSLGGYDLRSNADTKFLSDKAINYGAKLIVLDPLAGILRGGDENSVTSMQPVVSNLRRMAEFCQAAVLVIHHNNRGGFFRGSSALSAGMDLMLSIESEPTDSLIQLRTLKSRHQAPPTFCAEAHFEPSPTGGLVPRSGEAATWGSPSSSAPSAGDQPRFWLTPAERQTKQKQSPDLLSRSNAASEVLAFLAQHHEATAAQLMEETGVVFGTIHNTLTNLRASGLVERAQGGVSGKKVRYSLTKEGLEFTKTLTINETPLPEDDDD